MYVCTYVCMYVCMYEYGYKYIYIYIYTCVCVSDEVSDECVSTKLGVTVNHVLVSLALPFYDLALHLCVLSTI